MSMNIEQAKEIKQSRMWGLIVTELDEMIASGYRKFINCNKNDLPILQKEITMLELFKNLPDHVIDRET